MSKKRYILNFPAEASAKPLTYHLIKDYDLRINILRATINEGQEGRLLMEMEGDDLAGGLEFLRQEGIIVTPIKEKMSWQEEECVHCGACTAVCLSGAFRLDQQNWRVQLDPELCVVCGMCVNACPLKLISVGL